MNLLTKNHQPDCALGNVFSEWWYSEQLACAVVTQSVHKSEAEQIWDFLFHLKKTTKKTPEAFTVYLIYLNKDNEWQVSYVNCFEQMEKIPYA